MGWQFPYNYILNLNYYWELNPTNTNSEIATTEQPLKIILKSCIRLLSLVKVGNGKGDRLFGDGCDRSIFTSHIAQISCFSQVQLNVLNH
ncbi:hypothetical protein BCD67_12355 [Oscillatoriales cyanobacterium USR001]|nr:hypothetical protein BCD67_12355 [Oscillatoriales cyanobacterium USR001]